MTNSAPQIYSSQSETPTQSASKYLQQLCKHWSHNLEVEFDSEKARITFPANNRGANWKGDATLLMNAGETQLTCQLQASEAEQLDKLKSTVQSHLDRFAFREAPLSFDWQDQEIV